MAEQLARQTPSWTALEADLFAHSGGAYSPRQMLSLRRVPKTTGLHLAPEGLQSRLEIRNRVSILTPTTASRCDFHEQLWACFEAQTWADKELVVVETFDDEPSQMLAALAAQDERLVHVALHRHAGEDFSVGLKRNICVHLASGEVCVNFDDDDLYAGGYCEWMVTTMQHHGWGAVTLSAWHNYFKLSGECGFSDPDSWAVEDLQELTETIYGYGFSYVYRRSLALLHPYPDLEFGEDAPFMLRLRSVLGDSSVGLLKDVHGMCLHIVHRGSTCIDPEVSRLLDEDEFEDLQVCQALSFRRYLYRPWYLALWNWIRC